MIDNWRSDWHDEKLPFVFVQLPAHRNKHDKDFKHWCLVREAQAKVAATVKNAYRGYKEINLKAMKLLPRGGYLATCSCSHFMTAELFRKMLAEAAKDAGVQLRQIEERRQSPDHPILWGLLLSKMAHTLLSVYLPK